MFFTTSIKKNETIFGLVLTVVFDFFAPSVILNVDTHEKTSISSL